MSDRISRMEDILQECRAQNRPPTPDEIVEINEFADALVTAIKLVSDALVEALTPILNALKVWWDSIPEPTRQMIIDIGNNGTIGERKSMLGSVIMDHPIGIPEIPQIAQVNPNIQSNIGTTRIQDERNKLQW